MLTVTPIPCLEDNYAYLLDDGSGVVSQGWSAYLTCYSRELNLASDGTARININDPDLNNLNTNLQSALDFPRRRGHRLCPR